jgi:hypothetical protein
MGYYIVMEANCLVFPSPKAFDLAPIHVPPLNTQDKILLVPAAPHNNRHSLYSPLASSHSFRRKDDFADFLSALDFPKPDRTRTRS